MPPTHADTIMGQRLKALRLTKGLTQEQVAQKVGVSFQMLQKYEKGTCRVSYSRLLRLADALSVGVGVLLIPLPEPPPPLPDPLTLRATTSFAAIPSLALRRALLTLMKEMAEPETSTSA